MEAAAASRHLEIVLLHELNAGTFARLYLAEARAPGGIDRIVAVKILREQWSDTAEIVTRTRDEAKLLARLRHKNILRVEDLAQIDGQLGIIMEYVDGLDLKQLVEELGRRGQRLPARVAFQILQEAASALHAAYAKVPVGLDRPLRVVHRDLKPGNIMVSVEGEVKVLDFGTARSTHAARAAQTGAMRFGSLKYMSPERRDGDRGEHSSDVYALGQTLVELLTGEWLPMLPQDLPEHDEDVARILGELPPLGMSNREWEKAARQVLKQMLAGDPTLRPSAEQVHKLMRAFAEQAPGPSLDAYAHDVIMPITRAVRASMTGGALAGQRFTLAMGGSDPGSSSSRRNLRTVDVARGDAALVKATPIAPPKSGGQGTPPKGRAHNAPPAESLPAEPARSRPAAPLTNPRPFPEAEPGRNGARNALRSDAEPAPQPVREERRPPAARDDAPRPAPGRSEARLPPTPPPARPPQPVDDKLTVIEQLPPRQVPVSVPVPDPVEAPEPEPAERSWLPWLAAAIFIGGGLAVILLALVFAAMFALQSARSTPSGSTSPPAASPTTTAPAAPAPATPAPATPAPATPATTTTPSPASPATTDAPIKVDITGVSPQWVKLLAGETTVLKGTTSLAGAAPPGDYELALKAVGKPELRGAVSVPAGGLTLACAGAGEALTCTGGKKPVKLSPR